MKKLPRQNSPDNQIQKSSSNDLLSIKKQGFSKSFQKRYKVEEPSTVNSSSNLMKTFSKNKIKQLYLPKQSPTKPLERRSNSKSHLSKPIQKISLTSYAYHQANSLPTTTKLLKINNIFTQRMKLSPKQTLIQLYQQNQQYLEMLYQWQRLQIYDEIDKLVYKLSQNYIQIIEQVICKAYKDIDTKLQKYQSLIKSLEQENYALKQQNQKNQTNQQLLAEIQDRFITQFNKNQWSNIILQQMRRNNFDLDSFVKQMPIYKHMILQQSKVSNAAINQDFGKIRKWPKQVNNIRVTRSQAKFVNSEEIQRDYSVKERDKNHRQ